ncbi:hypothetical protein EZS27_035347 [termite gut metagenome]|uniref:Uncharacterized protein n=1 Tax=termite gut metagenome TaxID=433724 RepID=A0A5J4PY08_9ZZZZ
MYYFNFISQQKVKNISDKSLSLFFMNTPKEWQIDSNDSIRLFIRLLWNRTSLLLGLLNLGMPPNGVRLSATMLLFVPHKSIFAAILMVYASVIRYSFS